MSARGFTLIELLVATAILLVVAGTVSGLVSPVRATFDRTLGAGEAEARARTGITTITADLEDARSGSAIAAVGTVFADLVPPVALGASTLTITRIPAGAAQGVLATAISDADTVAMLSATAPCFTQDSVCGFRAGDTLAIFDAGAAAIVIVASINPATRTLAFASRVSRAFAAGATLVAIERLTYLLRSAADGSTRLVRISAGGAEQPLVDHVVRFEVAPWITLPARGIDVTLRVAAASPALRNIGGVPEVELRAAVLMRED
jgi:prepilin-type N-terminal cleavage/methylation domain-containing protein